MPCSSGLPAARAQTHHFDSLPLDAETNVPGAIDNGVADRFLLELDGHVTGTANQELALMCVPRVVAADEGVQ
ncbi:hypothetical protein D3C81_2097770 [compost metagenome]